MVRGGYINVVGIGADGVGALACIDHGGQVISVVMNGKSRYVLTALALGLGLTLLWLWGSSPPVRNPRM